MREPEDGDYAAAMRSAFVREYGFSLEEGRLILIDDARVRAVGASPPPAHRPIAKADAPGAAPAPAEHTRVYFEEGGWADAVPVHLLAELKAGHVVVGPAIVMNGTSTCVLEPYAVCHVTRDGDLYIEIAARKAVRTLNLTLALSLALNPHPNPNR